MTATTMPMFKLKDLHPSPTNPRRMRDAKADAELVESVKQHGVVTPLLLRARAAGGYEIVHGHRRRDAATKAGLIEVPANVRELDDATARELQIVENLQRADVHPLDEADAYKALIHDFKYDEAAIAARVGRTAAHVRARLQLVHLGAEGRKAWDEGKIGEDAAFVLARVPPALQKTALAEAIRDNTPEAYEALTEGREFSPVTGPQMRRIVRMGHTLPIASAPFPADDAKLLPKAGACATCPKSTDRQPVLFADLAPKSNLCTDPTCWKEKCGAQWERTKAEAKKAGERVLTAAEVAKLYPHPHDNQTAYGSEFVELDGKDPDHYSDKLVRSAFKKDDLPPIVHALRPDGTPVKLIARAAWEKTAHTGRGASASRSTGATAGDAKSKEARRKKLEAGRRDRALTAGGHGALIVAIVAAAETKPDDEGVLRALCARALQRIGSHDKRTELASRRNLPLEDASTGKAVDVQEALARFIASSKRATLRGFFVELLVEEDAWVLNALGQDGKISEYHSPVESLVKALGVNPKAVWSAGEKAAEKAFDAALEAKAAGKSKPPAAKPAKKGGKKLTLPKTVKERSRPKKKAAKR